MGSPEPLPEDLREPELAVAVPDASESEEAPASEVSNQHASEPDTPAIKKPKIRRDASNGAPLGEPSDSEAKPKGSRGKKRSGLEPNNVRKLRQEAMMSKAELARRAGVSPLTIDRVEAGAPCRMDTKRKILEALGLKPSARTEVWPDIDAQS